MRRYWDDELNLRFYEYKGYQINRTRNVYQRFQIFTPKGVKLELQDNIKSLSMIKIIINEDIFNIA